MTKKTAVATVSDDITQLPAYLQDANIGGDDNFDSSDVVIPRIKLLQGLSGEVEQFEDARSGHFWHTGLDKDLGPEIKFIVADRRKKYLLSAPLADGQGILARADDAKTWDRTGSWQIKLKGVKQPVTWEITDVDLDKSGMAKWGTSNPDDEDSPPAATMFYDYLVHLPEFPELGMAVISLARSSIRPAKKGLNDKIAINRQNKRPMQSLIFAAKSIEETSDDGPYKNWHFRSAGFVQDEALFTQMCEYQGSLANLKIKDEDGDREKDNAPADTGEGNF
jgi:hypothetical protein